MRRGFLFAKKKADVYMLISSNLVQGGLYSIENSYFVKFDKDNKMMDNKLVSGKGGRPHIYSHQDDKTGLLIFVPCSRQLATYKSRNDVELFPVETANGRPQALVIPRMIPVPEIYVKKEYEIPTGGNAATLDVTSASTINDFVEKTKSAYDRLKKGEALDKRLHDLSEVEIKAVSDQRQINLYNDYKIYADSHPNKIVIQKPSSRNVPNKRDSRYHVLGENAIIVEKELSIKCSEIATGINLSDKTERVRLNSKNVDEYAKQLNEKGYDVVVVERNGIIQEHPHTVSTHEN